MNSIDLTPIYRTSIGFDRMASLLDNALRGDAPSGGYPPYNIENLDENRYAITLAVAGFERSDLEISIDQSVLTVRGKKAEDDSRKYLYQGIANRAFERKFSLADHVEVIGAELNNGLLRVNLVKEIPEAMKPRTINITQDAKAIEHNSQAA